MQKSAVRYHPLELLIPLLIILPVVLVLLPSGLPNTADGPVHAIRAAEMINAWSEGVWIPRWAAHLGFGYGIPLFVFTPPLPYILAAFFHQLGFSLEMGMKLMLLTGLVFSGYGAYLLARDTLGLLPGAVGSAAFVYAPMVLRELFIQGNTGQFIGWSLLALPCWAVIRVYQTGQKRYLVALGLLVMAALLSHNVVALLLALMLALLTLTLFIATRNLGRTLQVIGGGLLGLALSAWFWMPALLEGRYLPLQRIVASNFRNRFTPLEEIFALSPPLDSGAINPYFPFTLGAIQVGLALVGTIGVVVAITNKKPRLDALTQATGLFFIAFSLFSGFMALRWSEPVWNHLPFVDMFEFPFRWYGVTLVGLSWLAAMATRIFRGEKKRAEQIASAVCLLLLLGSAIVNLYPHYLPPGRFKASPIEVVRYEAETGTVGSTSLGEFNPIWVTGHLQPTALAKNYLAGGRLERVDSATLPPNSSAVTDVSGTHAHHIHLNLSEAATITLNLIYFPGWTASLNGAPTPIGPHPGSGLIDIAVPAGQHQLELHFRETPLRRTANALSLLTWIGLIAAVGYYAIRAQRSGVRGQPIEARAQSPHSALLIVLVVIGSVILLRQTASNWFRIASPPDEALPASTQLRADFGDQIRLLGVDLPPQVAKQNKDLAVVAYWRALEDLDADYAVFLHLDAPNGQTFATVDQFHPTEIPTSQWPPTLYHRNALKLTIPSHAPPIRYSLRLGLYNNQSGERLTVNDGDNTDFEVGQVWVEARTAPETDARSRANFDQSITLKDAVYDPLAQTVTLYWQIDTPITQNYQIFLHALDSTGNIIGQVDGTPFQNQYPFNAWRPDQVIQDRRSLVEAVEDMDQISQIAVGIYDPANGTRLPASNPDGEPLLNDSFILKVAP